MDKNLVVYIYILQLVEISIQKKKKRNISHHAFSTNQTGEMHRLRTVTQFTLYKVDLLKIHLFYLNQMV